MNDITTLKDKIQNLINSSVEQNNHQKTTLNFLFTKLNEVKELETLERLKEFENGKYLEAYLFYQSIKRANYQPEHLELVKLENTEAYLKSIEKDIEVNFKEPEDQKRITNLELINQLTSRIKSGELVQWSLAYNELPTQEDKELSNQALINMLENLVESKEYQDKQAEHFLKKHGIKK